VPRTRNTTPDYDGGALDRKPPVTIGERWYIRDCVGDNDTPCPNKLTIRSNVPNTLRCPECQKARNLRLLKRNNEKAKEKKRWQRAQRTV